MTIPGGPQPTIKDLVKALYLYKPTCRNWKNVNRGVTKFYSLGRDALRAGIYAVIREGGHTSATLWVPDFLCREALGSLNDGLVTIRFYPIREDLSPDWTFIEQQDDGEGLRFFMLVHYFGFPNAAEKSRLFCDSRRMIFIEDCAHILYPTGTIGGGDIVFYSPRKFFAIPSGAILFMKPAYELYLECAGNPERDVTRWILYALLRKILLALRISWHNLRFSNRQSENVQDSEPKEYQGLTVCARYTQSLFALAEREMNIIVRQRRNLYTRLFELLADMQGVRPLLTFNEDKEMCPYMFPLYVEANAGDISGFLETAGIPVGRWPLFSREVLKDRALHKKALDIYEHLLLLPLHQSMTTKHIDTIAVALRKALHS